MRVRADSYKQSYFFSDRLSENALIFNKLKDNEGVFKSTLEQRDNKTKELVAAEARWAEIEHFCSVNDGENEANQTCEDDLKAFRKAQRISLRINETIESFIRDMSMVHFYFKELGVVKYTRDELYGIMDVIGNEEKGVRLFFQSNIVEFFWLQLLLEASWASVWASAC